MASTKLTGNKVRRRKIGGVWATDFNVPGFEDRIRRSCKTRDQAAAEIIANNLYQELLLETLTGKVERDVYTLEDVVRRYFEDHLSRKPCFRSVSYTLLTVVKLLGENKKLHEVSNNDLTKMVSTLRKKGLANSSINRHWEQLRAVMRMAERLWGAKVPVYPDLIDWKALRKYVGKEAKHRVRFLTQSEAHRLLDACGDHIRPVVMLALLTGMRCGNCKDLDWSEVDFRLGLITVRQKGGEMFEKKINKSIFDFLQALAPKKSGPVFTYKAKPLGSIRKAFENAVRRAGITDFTFHDLRHTYATWMRQAGADLPMIRDELGHATTKMTEVYANVGHDETASITNQIGVALQQQTVKGLSHFRHTSNRKAA
jgi:integrase